MVVRRGSLAVVTPESSLERAVAERAGASDALVDRHLRDLLAQVPAEPAAPGGGVVAPVDPGFAAHGARGVLRYDDHAVHAVDEP